MSEVIGGTRYFILHDDPLISMEYARNFAAGQGLVWNPGQPAIEGYSNFLWMLALAVFHLLPLSIAKTSLAVQITGALILVVNVWLCGRLALIMSPGDGIRASLSMVAVALYYPFAFWTIGGYETGLVVLFVLTGVLLVEHAREFSKVNIASLSFLLSLLVLTRPDGVVPAIALIVHALSRIPRERRPVCGSFLVASVILAIGAQTLFRLAYYGDPLPNTYYLKLTGVSLPVRVFIGLGYWHQILVDHLWLISIPLVTAGPGFIRREGPRSLPGFFILLFFLCSAYSVHAGGDAWEEETLPNRYLIVAMPGLLLLSVRSVCDVMRPGGMPYAALLVAVLTSLLLYRTVWKLFLPDFYTGLAVTPLPVLARGLGAIIAIGAFSTAAGIVVHSSIKRFLQSGNAPSRHQPSLAIVATVIVVAINSNVAEWATNLRIWSETMGGAVRYAYQLKAGTSPNAVIAVVGAGALPYYSGRDAVDLLGKCDAVVARLPPHREDYFRPGHNKWDFTHSVGKLRPDIVAQLHHDPREDIAYLHSIGYDQFPGLMFVDSQSTRVDRAILLLDRSDPEQFSIILNERNERNDQATPN